MNLSVYLILLCNVLHHASKEQDARLGNSLHLYLSLPISFMTNNKLDFLECNYQRLSAQICSPISTLSQPQKHYFLGCVSSPLWLLMTIPTLPELSVTEQNNWWSLPSLK